MSVLIVISMAFVVSYISYNVADGVIANYATYQELLEYDLHNMDYLAIMLGSTDSTIFPFVDTSNYMVSIPSFLFYMVGILLAGWRFIRLDRSYHPLLLARLRTQQHFLRYLQRGICTKIIVYSVSYTLISYGVTKLLAPYPKDSLTIETVAIMLLFTISRIVLLYGLTQIMLLIYLKTNAIIAQFYLLFIIMMCLIFGMNSDVVNIVFYNPRLYFIPTFIVAIVLLISSKKIKESMAYQVLEKE